MKKFLIIGRVILALIAFSSLVVSCGKRKTVTITKHTTILRLSDNHAKGYPTTQADEEFGRLVEEQTEGRIKVEVRAGGALSANENDAIEALKYGDLAFTRVSSSSISAYVDKINALQFPYLYRSSEHMWKVLNGSIGQSILKEIESSGSGLVGLCYYDGGARNFYLKKPIRSVEDMKGLRIRVMGTPLMVDMCAALGATGVTGMNMTEIRGAVESGRIDGAENNIPSYESNGDYSIAPYYTLDQHTRVPEVLVASAKVLARLDPKDVEIIKQVAKQTQEFEIAKWKEREVYSENICKQNGCQMIELSSDAAAKFQEAMAPVYKKHGERFTSILNEIKAVN